MSTGSVMRMTIGASIMPPTTTTASGFCTCEPIPVESAAGKSPTPAITQASDRGGEQDGADLELAGAQDSRGALDPRLDQLIELRQDDDAIHHRNAEQRDKPDRGGDAERDVQHE